MGFSSRKFETRDIRGQCYEGYTAPRKQNQRIHDINSRKISITENSSTTSSFQQRHSLDRTFDGTFTIRISRPVTKSTDISSRIFTASSIPTTETLSYTNVR